jgi:TDG/mug DNA glycosylase family protein
MSGVAINSFPPVEPEQARVLIIGSMPGKASLNAHQYYAHPRNAFWPILGHWLGFDAALPYEERLVQLQRHNVGLWDALYQCERPSSLDADIVKTSIVPNDFAGWFARHPETRAVLCNGTAAYDSYCKKVIPTLNDPAQNIPALKLPSTSPAHASLSADHKREQWEVLLDYL